MSPQSQTLLKSALLLPEAERAEIAATLIRSLDVDADPNADAAWAAEIARRIESIDNGSVKLVPWDDLIRELSQRVAC